MKTEPIGLSNPDKTVWWRVDLGGLRNIYSISVLFQNYNGYGDYSLSLKSYLKLCAPMQYYDANPESFNNATFAQKFNGLVEHVYVKMMTITKFIYPRTFQHCYLFLTFISNLY